MYEQYVLYMYINQLNYIFSSPLPLDMLPDKKKMMVGVGLSLLCLLTIIIVTTLTMAMKPTPKNGSWGSWADWSECSQSCGGGTETRRRLCDSPAPAQGGRDCGGDDSQQRECNTKTCLNLKGKSIWLLHSILSSMMS